MIVFCDNKLVNYNATLKKIACRDDCCFLIGTLEKRLCNKNFHEDYMDNVDEINFIINRDNGKTLGF